MLAALDQTLRTVPFLSTLGVRVEEARTGHIVLRLPLGDATTLPDVAPPVEADGVLPATQVASQEDVDAKAEVNDMLSNLEETELDAVIVATPHEDAAELLPDAAGVDRAALRGLGHSPIINLHVVFDRPVMRHAFAAGVGTPAEQK